MVVLRSVWGDGSDGMESGVWTQRRLRHFCIEYDWCALSCDGRGRTDGYIGYYDDIWYTLHSKHCCSECEYDCIYNYPDDSTGDYTDYDHYNYEW